MEFDELLPIARDFAFNKGKFTTTDLMDALNIGYNRANNLLNELQFEEVISEPLEGDERILLINKTTFIIEISKKVKKDFNESKFISLSYLKKKFALDETSAMMIFEEFRNDKNLDLKFIDNKEDFLDYISEQTKLNKDDVLKILHFIDKFYIADFAKEIILIKR